MALKDTQFLSRDLTNVALAKRYAALMDDAAALAAELDKVETNSESMALTLKRLRAKVEAHAVVSDLGPKLLAALSALGMTPSARAGLPKAVATVAPSTSTRTLARLRGDSE
jgi:phage shock protein A